jgi:DNA-binding HxlR family transcriptional regulator
MTPKRTYDDACAAAHGLDLVGERWALLVVRELVLGPKRFTDLRAGLPNISPNVLTQRLEDLEEAGIVHRRKLPPPAAAWVYELTEWGLGLEGVLTALGRWAARSPYRPADATMSIDSLVLSLRAMFDPLQADGVDASVELHFGDDRFRAEVSGGRLLVERGTCEQPDAVLVADPNVLAGVIYGQRKLSEALREGELTVKGDRAAARRFVALFPLPEPAPAV